MSTRNRKSTLWKGLPSFSFLFAEHTAATSLPVNPQVINESAQNCSNARVTCNGTAPKPTTGPIPHLPQRSSMCLEPSARLDHTVEPSPYLLRTWSAPNTATAIRQSRKLESPNRQHKAQRPKMLSPKLMLAKNRVRAAL